MTTFAVGDIQGCYAEFRDLLDLMQFRPAHDRLWLAGDLINRGPHNLATMQYVMSLPDVKVVLGNHDLHFLAVARGLHSAMPGDTLDDLLESPSLPEIIDWLRFCPLIHIDRRLGYVLVHAGIPPIWTLEQTVSHAEEVAHVLREDDYGGFLGEMYGNDPDRWDPALTGQPRLRVITNYLTRLRYCTPAGRMDLTHKANVQPEGYLPWFRIPRPAGENYKILFGHWAALDGSTGVADIIGLDTGCVWGRRLTGIRVDDARLFSVPSRSR